MGKVKFTIQFTPSSERQPGSPKAKLPRKLKKDIIKVAGRDSFYRVMYIMTLQYVNTGNQYIKIKRGNG